VAKQVIAGKFGNGDARATNLRNAGYDPAAVQAEVNRQLGGGSAPSAPAQKSVADIAKEVIAGEWGNGPQRSQRLAAAGYDPAVVQNEVNRQLGANVGHAPTALSVGLLASQVIAGQWGSGQDRINRLTSAGYDAFDPDLIMHINGVFSTLNQLGVGPDEGFMITGDQETWDTFLGTDPKLNQVKTYVYLRVRLLFDPPQTAFLADAYAKQIEQLEWRLNVQAEGAFG
jgi:hypothetical protein